LADYFIEFHRVADRALTLIELAVSGSM